SLPRPASASRVPLRPSHEALPVAPSFGGGSGHGFGRIGCLAYTAWKGEEEGGSAESPAPAQAAPEISSTLGSIPDKLKEFGNTLEDKARAAIESIKQSDIPAKTRNWFSETFNKVKEQLKTAFS
uniref:Apolipoprotein C-I n=1 Tax=Ursus americanus TaxID=9643 RepID=A0A452SDT4_URSAM